MAKVPDTYPLDTDDDFAPEFSTRLVNLLRKNRIETVGDLRANIDRLHLLRGCGGKSLREAKAYLRWIDEPESLFSNPQILRERTEQDVGIIVRDVQAVVSVLIPALSRGRVSPSAFGQARIHLTGALQLLDRLEGATREGTGER